MSGYKCQFDIFVKYPCQESQSFSCFVQNLRIRRERSLYRPEFPGDLYESQLSNLTLSEIQFKGTRERETSLGDKSKTRDRERKRDRKKEKRDKPGKRERERRTHTHTHTHTDRKRLRA